MLDTKFIARARLLLADIEGLSEWTPLVLREATKLEEDGDHVRSSRRIHPRS